jgi:hypothetical protein
MNTPALTAHWPVIAANLKAHWPQLTDEDLRYIPGSEEALIAHIQKQTSATRIEIEAIFEAEIT